MGAAPRLSRLLCLLAALLALPAQAALFDDEEARRQIAALKAATEQRLDIQQKAFLDLAAQLQSQKEDNAKLRGQVETLSYELELAKKRQQDFYVDLDNRVRKLEPQAGGEAPAKAGDPAAIGKEYEAALDLFKGNKFKDAASAFAAFVTAHPEAPLAANAQFWLGNAWLAQRDCKRASEAHSLLVSKWPNSPKAPDALLAVANCQQELGNAAAAKKALETMISQYPDAPVTATARTRLKKK